jgi:outer membrane protein TolC
VDVARAPAAPVLTLGRTRYSAREEVSVSQEVRWGGERRNAVRSAEETAASARADAARALLEARRDVSQAWFDLAAAEDAVAFAEDTLQRAQKIQETVSARVEGGRAPRLDLVRADAELARLSADALASGEERRAAWAHLAALLDLPPREEGGTDGARPPALAPDAGSALAARGTEAHPAVVAASAALSAARAAHREALARRLPGLSFTAGVNADDPGLPGPDWFGTAALTIPIGARTASIGVTEAEIAVAEARLEAAKREAAEALEGAYRRVLAARARLEAYEQKALPAAEEAASLTREAYGYGRGDIFHVVEAERSLIDVRRARAEAYRDVKKAEADLLAAAGEADVEKK